MKRKGMVLLLAAALSAVLTACGDAGSRTAKITVTYLPEWDNRETASAYWKKTYEGEEAAELLALLKGFSYSGPTCDCGPAYILETGIGGSYGYKPGEYVRQGEGQKELTENEGKQLQELFDMIEAQGEDVPQE